MIFSMLPVFPTCLSKMRTTWEQMKKVPKSHHYNPLFKIPLSQSWKGRWLVLGLGQVCLDGSTLLSFKSWFSPNGGLIRLIRPDKRAFMYQLIFLKMRHYTLHVKTFLAYFTSITFLLSDYWKETIENVFFYLTFIPSCSCLIQDLHHLHILMQ